MCVCVHPHACTHVDACSLLSPVQVILLHVVVALHPEQLDVLVNEAGRQQAVDPQLLALLQGEGHALRTEDGWMMTVRDILTNGILSFVVSIFSSAKSIIMNKLK